MHPMRVFIAGIPGILSERLIELVTKLDGCEIAGQSSSLHEVVKLIYEIKPDVVLLDSTWKEGNGLDVLQIISRVSAKSKIIFMANFLYPQLRKKSLEEGADLFVCKSDAAEKIIEVLHDWRQG